MPESRARAFLYNLAAMLLGLTLAVTVLEIALVWIVPPPLHYVYPQPLYDPDPRVGWVMRPHQHAYTIDKPVVTNSLGFRSAEIPIRKDPGGLRILCLGDSQAFGNGVAQEETYSARLQALLASRRTGGRVEVMNMGVQGFDPLQEVDLLERVAPLLEPDVVTIAIYLNDMGDAVRGDKLDMLDPRTGEFKRTGIKSLTPYRLIYLAKRSRPYTLVGWRLRILKSGAADNPLTSVLGVEHFDPTPRLKADGGDFDRCFIRWDGHISASTHSVIAKILADMIETPRSAIIPRQTTETK